MAGQRSLTASLQDWPRAAVTLIVILIGLRPGLQARGVPVHRLVHEEGSFVLTFPNAYHAGFNTGARRARATSARSAYCQGSAHALPVSARTSAGWLFSSCTDHAAGVSDFVSPGLPWRWARCEAAGARCGAGFNCAEAVNFGPPDWLPWGSYVADKYRAEGRSATLSHDALLVALVRAAPAVAARAAGRAVKREPAGARPAAVGAALAGGGGREQKAPATPPAGAEACAEGKADARMAARFVKADAAATELGPAEPEAEPEAKGTATPEQGAGGLAGASAGGAQGAGTPFEPGGAAAPVEVCGAAELAAARGAAGAGAPPLPGAAAAGAAAASDRGCERAPAARADGRASAPGARDDRRTGPAACGAGPPQAASARSGEAAGPRTAEPSAGGGAAAAGRSGEAGAEGAAVRVQLRPAGGGVALRLSVVAGARVRHPGPAMGRHWGGGEIGSVGPARHGWFLEAHCAR